MTGAQSGQKGKGAELPKCNDKRVKYSAVKVCALLNSPGMEKKYKKNTHVSRNILRGDGHFPAAALLRRRVLIYSNYFLTWLIRNVSFLSNRMKQSTAVFLKDECMFLIHSH